MRDRLPYVLYGYVIYGALVPWGMRDRWPRSRQPVLEGAPA